MRELHTVFPYGLNDEIDVEGIDDAYQHIVSGEPRTFYCLFNAVKMVVQRGDPGINKKEKIMLI